MIMKWYRLFILKQKLKKLTTSKTVILEIYAADKESKAIKKMYFENQKEIKKIKLLISTLKK